MDIMFFKYFSIAIWLCVCCGYEFRRIPFNDAAKQIASQQRQQTMVKATTITKPNYMNLLASEQAQHEKELATSEMGADQTPKDSHEPGIELPIRSVSDTQVVKEPSFVESRQTKVVVRPNDQPVLMEFNTQSSPIHVKQSHSANKGSYQKTDSEEEPHKVVHRVVKPVVQELTEIVKPYRNVLQVIGPVKEQRLTRVHKKFGRTGRGQARRHRKEEDDDDYGKNDKHEDEDEEDEKKISREMAILKKYVQRYYGEDEDESESRVRNIRRGSNKKSADHEDGYVKRKIYHDDDDEEEEEDRSRHRQRPYVGDDDDDYVSERRLRNKPLLGEYDDEPGTNDKDDKISKKQAKNRHHRDEDDDDDDRYAYLVNKKFRGILAGLA